MEYRFHDSVRIGNGNEKGDEMRKLLICLYAAVLCACAMTREPDLEHRGPGTSDNKVELHLIRNSTYQAVDRKGRIPVGYGLYSYVLLKAQTEN